MAVNLSSVKLLMGFRLDGKLNAITGKTYIEKGVINSAHITDLQMTRLPLVLLMAEN